MKAALRGCRIRLDSLLAKYSSMVGITVDGFGPHALRATAITNALENNADLEKVQEWVGHANVSTTRLYDRRQARTEESPTFRVVYATSFQIGASGEVLSH
jgi:integrase/recombinase XerD